MKASRNPKGWGWAAAGVAMLVAGAVSAPTVQAQTLKPVPRERTYIHVGWSGGSPMLTSPRNANWYSLSSETRNGIDYVWEPLFFYNSFRGEHIGWLASGFTYSPDHKTLRVNIRPGVKWSDGEDFDAEDVAFTLTMLVENGKGAKDLRKALEVTNQVVRAVAENKLTVRIELTQPDPRFIYRHLTNYFGHGLAWVPEHIWKGVQDKAAFTFYDPAKGWPVGTGAWKLMRAEPQQMILDRREDWWGAKTGFRPLPAVERIITVPAADSERQGQLIVSNEVDAAWSFATPQLVKQLMARNPKLTTFSGNKPPFGNMDWWPTSLYFNNMSEMFKDVRVRRAVRFAINRQQIIDFAYEGNSEVNFFPYPAYAPLLPFINEAMPLVQKHRAGEFNLQETERLMKEAGYAKDTEGIWAKDGKRIGGTIEMQNVLAPVGQIVVQQLKNAGFDAKFSSTPDSFRRFRSGETDWHIFGHNGGSIFDPVDTLFMYHSRNQAPVGKITFFVARWSHPEFDKIVEQMEKLPVGDPGLKPLFVRAMDVWFREVPEVPIQQMWHWYPMNTTYWTNWPSLDNPYIQPCTCFQASMPAYVAHNLKPVK